MSNSDDTHSGAAHQTTALGSAQLPQASGEIVHVPRSDQLADDDAADGGEHTLHRMRVSKVEVLLNTNLSGGVAIVDALEQYLYERLFVEATLERLIPLEPRHRAKELLREVEVLAPAIEVGSQQRRVHAHYILRIRHAGKLILGQLQPALQQHVRRNSMFRGAFVSVRLLNAAADNYALKETFLQLPIIPNTTSEE